MEWPSCRARCSLISASLGGPFSSTSRRIPCTPRSQWVSASYCVGGRPSIAWGKASIVTLKGGASASGHSMATTRCSKNVRLCPLDSMRPTARPYMRWRRGIGGTRASLFCIWIDHDGQHDDRQLDQGVRTVWHVPVERDRVAGREHECLVAVAITQLAIENVDELQPLVFE